MSSDDLPVKSDLHPVAAAIMANKEKEENEAKWFMDSLDMPEAVKLDFEMCNQRHRMYWIKYLECGGHRYKAAREIGCGPKEESSFSLSCHRAHPLVHHYFKNLANALPVAAARRKGLSDKLDIMAQLDHLINGDLGDCLTFEEAKEAGLTKLIKKMEVKWIEDDDGEEKPIRVITEWHNALDYVKEMNKMQGNYAPHQVEQKSQTLGADGMPVNPGPKNVTYNVTVTQPEKELNDAPVRRGVSGANFILGGGDDNTVIEATNTTEDPENG